MVSVKDVQEDRVISEFLRSLGPWRNHVVIGGGFAPFIYKLYLSGPGLDNLPIGTRDIDSLIPRKVPRVAQKNIAQYLKEAGFTPFFKDMEIPATESYIKEIDGIEVEIEFLTDAAIRKDKYKNVMVSGIVAQPLSYLLLSLQSTKRFKTYSGEAGKVVSPEAWIFHKGLTFPKRKENSKKLKDLYGIWYTVTQLDGLSEQILRDLGTLTQKYPKWFQIFRKQLSSWSEHASPDEWLGLEAQDPIGRLTKIGFEYVLERIFV